MTGLQQTTLTENSFARIFAKRTHSSGYLAGFIDTQGKVANEPHFDDCGKFSCMRAVVTLGGRNGVGETGYIDPSGHWIVKPSFRYGGDFVDGLARVQLADKWGIISTDGDYLIRPIYEMIGDFSDGLARVYSNR